MTKRQKTICATAALCLMGTALAGVSTVAATGEEAAYSFQEAMTPIWEGDISYMESVLPVENEFGGIDPIQLLYPIEEIIEVKNATLTVTYEKGVDYTVAGGKLIISDEGSIPVMSYAEFHPVTGQKGFEAKDGGYICFSEGDYFHSRQIVVTYKHTAVYEGYIPEGKRELLPNTIEKLKTKETFDLLVFGDSISVGANSSGMIGTAPYMPNYAQLFAMQLEKAYGCKVNLINPSVGGKGITWGLEEIENVIDSQPNVDLAVIAFGMNDGNMLSGSFSGKVNRLAGKIEKAYPDVETLAIATMLPNPQAKNFYLNQMSFYDAMVKDCQREGLAVVDMTAVHKSLLERKQYADMTGNNVNHPNDYLARVYAQTLFATLQQKVEVEEDKVDFGNCLPDDNTDTIGQQQPTISFFSLLTSGCSGTAPTAIGAATALGVATVALKKKKDD